MDLRIKNREITYKILYKKLLDFDCIEKHLIPTKKDWIENKSKYNIIYNNYVTHTKKLIKEVKRKVRKMRRVKILALVAVVAIISIIASGCKSVKTNI